MAANADADQPPALPPPVANVPNADSNDSGINGNVVGRVSPIVAGRAAQHPPQNNQPEDGLGGINNNNQQQHPQVLVLPQGVNPPTVVAQLPLFPSDRNIIRPENDAAALVVLQSVMILYLIYNNLIQY